MKVHITGGKGFLGQYVSKGLFSNYTVDISDLDTLDVTDLDATIKHLGESKPDLVCHLAGLTGAHDSIEQPHKFFNVNCFGTLNVLEACRILGISNFVFMSTLTVHGVSDGSPIQEHSPCKPRHPYAASKAAAEVLIENYSNNYGLNSVILRATLIAGEGQKEPSAVTEFVDLIRNQGTIELYGEGTHKREWLHPLDLARAVRAAVGYLGQNSSGGCEKFIISSGVPVSMRDLAYQVISTLGKGKVEFRPTTRQAFSLCTVPAKAKNELRWTPQISIDEIIQRVSDNNGK